MDEDDKRHEVCHIDRIPGLYMTDWVGAASVNENNILGITHILSVLTKEEYDQYGPDETPGVVLRHLEVKDEPTTDLLKHLVDECDWIEKVLTDFRTEDGSRAAIIVHCQQGISRSAAVIVAYMMRKLNLTFDEAVADLKKSRSIINMNTGFAEQLRAWEKKLRGSGNEEVTLSPKTPVNVIGPLDIINWREDEGK